MTTHQSDTYDVIVIGGGHNGLVAANYLGRSGKKVLVVERREILGGACVTEEFFPGAKFSSCSFIQAVLRPKVIDELELVSKYGLEMYAPDPQGFALFEDGEHLILWHDIDKTLKQLERMAPEDAKGLMKFGSRLRRFGDLTNHWTLDNPPTRSEMIKLFEDANEEDLLNEFMFMSTRDLLNRYFTSSQVRGFYTFFGIVSIWGGPSTPGTAYLFGYHASGEFEGTFGRWAFPKGGMGSITASLEKGARDHGVDIITGTPVAEVVVSSGKATGVRLEDGRTFEAKAIMSNADPKRTLQTLVPEKALSGDFRKKVSGIDTRGSMARLHLLIDELPHYIGFDSADLGPQHKGHAILGGSEEAFEDAYAAMLRGEFPDKFPLEAIIQSATDDSLTEPGKHAMILGVQNLPFELAEGDWDSRREEFQEKVLECLFQFAPNLRDHVLGCHTITPLDLQRTYGITGGNIFHVAMTMEHMFNNRPLPELSDYRTPVKGLYLCSAGTHPGGGVIGAPGHNAAQTVIDDLEGRVRKRAASANIVRNASIFDKVMQSDLGASISYHFARNRAFRAISRLGTKARKED
ncbi:NAD(P)/FAD-dependent oxidoreductase [Ruegeria sp. HKCCD8929]|uniref:phytoene desaturase family protein n=1 Tax=Ruegeria sp. HKCCD8929 TaxID=2683006 RepID=UPI001488A43B|nr:NAD(P)/FAD-dependent oxidoreductase [Ruegeria sp. HKCCD8929]